MQKRFNIIYGDALMDKPLAPIRFIVDSLMPQGLHMLAGAPKTGKSWLALWLCLQIAKGEDVWNFKTEKGTTLYLCLEDSENRIQNRLFDVTDDAPPNICFTITSNTIGDGLSEQIETFVSEHPGTNLIVIDTLQKIRQASTDNAYASDYRELGVLKSIADRFGIAILLIHHLRKQKDGDPLNMVSGTTGMTGAVDNNFVLIKDSRSSNNATLMCSGRDIVHRELKIKFDSVTPLWLLVADSVENPEILLGESFLFLCELLRGLGSFAGTPTELFDALQSRGLEIKTSNVLSKKLLEYQGELENLGIIYTNGRSNGKRIVSVSVMSDDSAERNDISPHSETVAPVDPAGTAPP